MTGTTTNDNRANGNRAPANVGSQFDFSRLNEMNGTMLSEGAKLNARLSETVQTIGKEWAEFIGTRLGENNRFFQTLHACKSVPDMQQAYARFWLDAFTQYGEEAQRLMRISQSSVEETVRTVQQAVPTDPPRPDLDQAA
ncbi:hypothetical protein ASC80_00290 [Afipia sp. Root123D2]|uniref:phasin family protein n=1 Tax=Afipia sp. Root123D2 TaxID=1736436 RepID=UPI0006FB50DA|nr:phasin family protein [Afipia sp. Root123D2]KQW21891.1 hypothetical protein ASC80_00290 [Afipia sp. Root123D2]